MKAFDSVVLHTTAGQPVRAALVWMPFSAIDRPSIQVGLLRAIADRHGFQCDTYHLNLELAARIPYTIYKRVCDTRYHQIGEWLWGVAAFGEDGCSPDADYLAAFPEITDQARECGMEAGYWSTMRHEVLPSYIDDCLHMIDWGQYQLIGFSSTFQQNVASLALARKIKQRYPHTQIVFGGANVEGEMGLELMRAFDFINYVVLGEGDLVFPALLGCLARGESPANVPGVAMRADGAMDGGIHWCKPDPPLQDLDNLPTPNYDEYYERLGSHTLPSQDFLWRMPFESSRGCWWGQKHQCTFCGLNGAGIAYRAKSSERVLEELAELARKHRISFFEATDSVLNMKYLQTLFPAIEELKADYQFFYEIKANLKREQIATLYRGGIRWVQPGIESLNTHLLQLMGKGCTMLHNLRTLKWCRYYRISTDWNLLWGFPGETEEDYVRQLEVMRLITHLQPPLACGRIWLERYSPHFTQQAVFGIADARPERSYQYIYPRHVALERLAYFFDYNIPSTLPDEAHRPTAAWLQEWRQRWNSSHPDTLCYRRTQDSLFVDDNRGPERRGSHAFYGPLALTYEYCSETMRTAPEVVEYLSHAPEVYSFSQEEVQAALDLFCRLGLAIGEDGQYLSLALPMNPNW